MSNKNHALSIDSISLTKPLTALLIALSVLYFPNVYADAAGALPTGGGLGLPGTEDGASFGKMMVSIIKWGISILAVCALGYGLSGSIFKLFALVNDARNGEGGWGPAISQMLIILLVVAAAIMFFGLINKFVFTFLDTLTA